MHLLRRKVAGVFASPRPGINALYADAGDAMRVSEIQPATLAKRINTLSLHNGCHIKGWVGIIQIG